jgi:hypothetical protein
VIAPEGQIQFETRGDSRTLTGDAIALTQTHPFRPYRWMDPARERARRTLPAHLRQLIQDRAQAPNTTHTAA